MPPQWEEQPATDPFGVRAKQPANVGGSRYIPRQWRPFEEPTAPWPLIEPSSDAAPADIQAPADTDIAARVSARAIIVYAAHLAAVVFVGLRLFISATTTPVSRGEGYLLARIGASGSDLVVGPTPWPQRTVSALLSAWVSLTGALYGQLSVAVHLRIAMALAGVVIAGLIWSVTAQLRLAAPVRILAILLVGAVPGSTWLVAGRVNPGTLAAVLVALATVLIAGEHTGTPSRVIASVSTALAILLVPVAAAGLLAAVAVLLSQGDLAPRMNATVRNAVAAGCAGAGGVVVAGVVLRAPGWLMPPIGTPLTGVNPIEIVVALIVVALTVIAVFRRWLRAPAAAACVMLVCTLLAPASARADLLTVTLPIAIVVATGCGDDLFAHLRRSIRWQQWFARRATAAATVVTIVLVTAVIGTLVNAPAASAAPATASVASWFATEVPGHPSIMVDDALVPEMIRSGFQGPQLRTSTGVGGTAPADWIVTTAAVPVTRWQPYASFGTGTTRIIVARRIGTGPSVPAPTTLLGTALTDNRHLTFGSSAAQALRSGLVDDRLILILGELAGQQDLTVDTFPVVPGEGAYGTPLRRMLITTVDGRPATDPLTAQLISHWLNEQLAEFHPAGIDTTPDGLLVRYSLSDTSQ